MDHLSAFFSKNIYLLRPQDAVDILLVAYVVYKGMQIIRETRAAQLVKGLLLLIVMMQISEWTKLYTTNYILRNTMQVGILAVVVVFQPELRRGLEQVGRSSLGRMFSFDEGSSSFDPSIVTTEVCEAVRYMSENRVGGLIVIERQTKIGDIIRTGVMLRSEISAELLVNVFVPNTPLHDGAVVIRNNQIMAAACLLPLTANQNLSLELGTRHRAALGLSENSDAVIVVISEETGKISLALSGSLTRNLTVESLQKALGKILQPDDSLKVPAAKVPVWKGRAK